MSAQRCNRQERRHQLGLSIVELMVAMVLGLLVISAVIYVFAGNRASFRHQEALTHVQETARFALEMLNRDLRMAGYVGCGNLRELHPVATNVAGPNPPLLTPDNAITGTATTLTLGLAGPEIFPLAANMSALNLLSLGVNPGFAEADQVIVTNCAIAEMFVLNEAPEAAAPFWNLKASDNLFRLFPTNAQVMRMQWVAYVFDAGTNTLRRNNEIIAEGVTAFAFEYGTGPNRRVEAYTTTPANWRQVSAVRVNMTLAGLADANVSHAFTSTIGLRNRLP